MSLSSAISSASKTAQPDGVTFLDALANKQFVALNKIAFGIGGNGQGFVYLGFCS